MSYRDSRRTNIPAANRRATSSSRPHSRPSPSPAPRKIRLRGPSKNFKTLNRSKSDPSLYEPDGGDQVAVEEEDDGVLYRLWTCTDIFESPANSVPLSSGKYTNQEYNSNAKVVVNVTVEGSPGPIRTMVKLGSNVEETIKLVIDKYSEEGRTPPLDKDAASTYELHHSHFSLQSLSKSDLIGNIGSRSFYLRRNRSGRSSKSLAENMRGSSNASIQMPSSPTLLNFLPSFIDRKVKKMIQRTHIIWKIFGCLPCSV